MSGFILKHCNSQFSKFVINIIKFNWAKKQNAKYSVYPTK
ncbi:Uncharacterized protein dnm_057950 [Desulfonema magnum]|uniref:Uncharacterized protein n=1 Tax=Desulfonema magnum TaxID=45655 RepID=A0A975BQG6_9BACT|nr:Uncharacterized protein dnm_057950 [Desulfonema magnum]